MKNYYIAQVRVIIEGNESIIIPISGENYNPDAVKSSAESQVREQNHGKRITSVILSKVDLNLEEYKKAINGTPLWFGKTDSKIGTSNKDIE